MKKNLLFFPISFLLIFGFLSCSFNPVYEGIQILPPSSFPNHVDKDSNNKIALKQILTNDETTDVLNTRSFSTDKPIQAVIDNNGKLVITSYAPTMVKGVQVFNGTTPLVHIDEVYGFSQSSIEIKEKLDSSVVLTVISNDPFMKKIETIKSPIKVNFGTSDGGPWKTMTGKTSREASIIAITMSYMYNHERYLPYLTEWHNGGYQGKEVIWSPIPIPGFGNVVMPANPFKSDDGKLLEPEQVKARALGANQIKFSLIKDGEPAGGIGGAGFLGMRAPLYSNFARFAKLDPNAQKQQDSKSYIADVIFHEFGHCMGFYHDADLSQYKGTMTYGGAWTNVNYRFLNDLIEKNDLPIPLDGQWESRLGYPSKL